VVGETDLSKLLESLEPHLMDGDFVFSTIQDAKYGDFAELLPIASFCEAEGLTLLIAKENAEIYLHVSRETLSAASTMIDLSIIPTFRTSS